MFEQKPTGAVFYFVTQSVVLSSATPGQGARPPGCAGSDSLLPLLPKGGKGRGEPIAHWVHEPATVHGCADILVRSLRRSRMSRHFCGHAVIVGAQADRNVRAPVHGEEPSALLSCCSSSQNPFTPRSPLGAGRGKKGVAPPHEDRGKLLRVIIQAHQLAEARCPVLQRL